MKEKKTNIISNPRRYPVTFVTVVFFLILVYIILQTVRYFTGDVIQVYSIGNIDADNVYASKEGILLREENLYHAAASGYVNYYAVKNERISKDSVIVSIDQKGDLQERMHKLYYGQDILSSNSLGDIRDTINSEIGSYSRNQFSSVSDIKTAIQADVFQNLLKDSGDEDLFDDDSIVIMKTDASGFICYYEDGFEYKTAESLLSSDFDTADYSRVSFNSGDSVKSGDPVYKLAADNQFQLVFLLSESDLVNFSGRKNLTVRFPDGIEVTGAFSISKTADGQSEGIITFKKYGSNFLENRMITFQILDKEVTGYKIPESAITTKSFFVVDTSYIIENTENNSVGVLRMDEQGTETFITCTVYAKTRETDENAAFILGDHTAYIYSDELHAGDVLISMQSGNLNDNTPPEKTTLGIMTAVEGVYQVNKGYCIFKPIVRLSNSLETSYVVISPYVRQGLQPYDRIVLDASLTFENEIIFE